MRDPLIQAEVCRRIAAVLAAGGVHDHLGYDALARVKLPGPDYLAVLSRLHVETDPDVYIEIGVRDGKSIRLARHNTLAIGVDPIPAASVRGYGAVHRQTSDQFFEMQKQRQDVPRFDLAFIDGDHHYEQARRDFENLLTMAKPGAVIALHDVIPMDERTATPVCSSSFWTGDVWRLMADIVASGFRAITVACPPTGLGLVACPGPEFNAITSPELDMDWNRLVGILNIKPNHWDEVLSFLAESQTRHGF